MLPKRVKTDKDALTIAVLTILTVFIWTGLGVYRSFKKSIVPKVLEGQLRSLTPSFDKEVIRLLETRLSISEGQLESLPARRMSFESESIVGETEELGELETASPGGELQD